MSCSNCGGPYTQARIQCLCNSCERGKCIYCCFAQDPYNIREILLRPPEHFICYSCSRARHLDAKCACCRKAFLCGDCCRSYRHICCKPSESIRFVNRPLRFVYPAISEEGLGWSTRESSEAILTKTASRKDYRIDFKKFTANSSHRFAAVELEVLDYESAATLNKVLAKWKCSVVQDNSMLREFQRENPNENVDYLKPFEINSTPACGDALLWQIKEICEALETSKAKVALSCGIHVHVDCRDFGYQELQKLIRVYALIEETLFAAVHWSRFGNEFCRHCGAIFKERFIDGVKPDTKDLKTHLISSVYGAAALESSGLARRSPLFRRLREDHYGRIHGFDRNPMRYSALNLHSYFLRGTVESRIHHASTDYKEVYAWAKILVDLFDIVGRLSDEKLQKLLIVKKTEILGACDFLSLERSNRIEIQDRTIAVAKGFVILRSLLPDESFQALTEKIKMACLHPEVSKQKTLPCQI